VPAAAEPEAQIESPGARPPLGALHLVARLTGELPGAPALGRGLGPLEQPPLLGGAGLLPRLAGGVEQVAPRLRLRTADRRSRRRLGAGANGSALVSQQQPGQLHVAAT